MPNYLSMLHAANVFGRGGRGFGVMPDIGGDPLAEAANVANQMKNDDMNRAKEMMEFQRRLGIQEDQRRASEAALTQNERTVFGPNKKRIVQYAPPTGMQQQFRQDKLLSDQRKQQTDVENLRTGGRLQQALLTGRLRNEGTAATAAANSTRAELDRASREKVASDRNAAQDKRAEADRRSRETIAETGKNTPYVIDDPDKPGSKVAVVLNPRTGKLERAKLDGGNVGALQKPGTPGKSGEISKDQQGTIDMATQALAEIDNNLLDKEGNLTDKAKWATGATGHFSKLPWPTDAAAGQASIKMVASQQVLKLIGDLKAQSRTGATGLGNMSNQDRQTLEAAATKLSPENIVRMSEKEIKTELNRIRDILRATIAAPRNAGKPGGPVTREQAMEKIRQFGGQ